MYTILPVLHVLASQLGIAPVNEVQLGSVGIGMFAAVVYHVILARIARRAVRGRS